MAINWPPTSAPSWPPPGISITASCDGPEECREMLVLWPDWSIGF